MSGLSGADREAIAKARELAGLRAVQIREYTGDDDLGMAYAVAFGRAQWQLGDLLRIIDRLVAGDQDQAAGDAPQPGQLPAAEAIRRITGIRALLAGFDWEHDDRQYALEAIDRIAGGVQE